MLQACVQPQKQQLGPTHTHTVAATASLKSWQKSHQHAQPSPRSKSFNSAVSSLIVWAGRRRQLLSLLATLHRIIRPMRKKGTFPSLDRFEQWPVHRYTEVLLIPMENSISFPSTLFYYLQQFLPINCCIFFSDDNTQRGVVCSWIFSEMCNLIPSIFIC
jgi:hypothetical protein